METEDIFLAFVKANVRYEPYTGLFWWKKSGPGRFMARPIGHVDDEGRCRAQIMGRKVRLHRLAWLMTHGRWPTDMIDHIDGNTLNNRISNLRECSMSGNQQNRGPMKGRDLPIGVSRRGSRFQAQITSGGVFYNLGQHDTVEEATAAYLAAKASFHKFCAVPYSLAAAPAPAKAGEA